MVVYDFWTHGTSVQVQSPERVKYIFRAGWGTVIRQEHESENWFHFAIPTTTILGDKRPVYGKAYLQADTGNADNPKIDIYEAFVEQIHVWDGTSQIETYLLNQDPTIGLNIGPISFGKDLPEKDVNWGTGISVKVKFVPPKAGNAEERGYVSGLGQIWFKSAGIRVRVE